MEYEETVTISAVYFPTFASMDFGLIDFDGGFYPVRASGGSINKTIIHDFHLPCVGISGQQALRYP